MNTDEDLIKLFRQDKREKIHVNKWLAPALRRVERAGLRLASRLINERASQLRKNLLARYEPLGLTLPQDWKYELEGYEAAAKLCWVEGSKEG